MKPALVLAYHGLGSFPRQLDPHNLMVAPERFVQQVRQLRRRGYRFVRLTQFAADLDARAPAARTCALTFDDGTRDNLDVLLPLLVELDAPATVFVCPGLLGDPHFAMPAESGVRLMNTAELRELARSPLIDVGSHTHRHLDMSQIDSEQAHSEMVSSKRALEELLQRDVAAFAYPKCCYSPACPDAARQAGYSVAVTCGARGGWRRFELARESVDSLDGRITFALKSRRLFLPLRNSPPGRLARAAARSYRHGDDPEADWSIIHGADSEHP